MSEQVDIDALEKSLAYTLNDLVQHAPALLAELRAAREQIAELTRECRKTDRHAHKMLNESIEISHDAMAREETFKVSVAELTRERDALVEIRAIVAVVDEGPDDSEDGRSCRRCDESMHVPVGFDPTAVCNLCAQTMLEGIAALARKGGST